MKQTIRLTESQFKKLITETIKKVLRENQIDNDDDALQELSIDELRNNFEHSLKGKSVKISGELNNYRFTFSEIDYNHLNELSTYVIFLTNVNNKHTDEFGEIIYLLVNKYGRVKQEEIFDPSYRDFGGRTGCFIATNIMDSIDKKLNPQNYKTITNMFK